ncbi:peroxiredoxin [Halosegnis marinus]|uniref:thioredoxin-dependent peroxiredoxin n=1 Tax=Halosegnis marinus TaxID=3034023 RepID=A0ABD5ZP75_9EURY|nr:peroxiredoxin [Halosegnis sp. DT85]
MLEAGDAAPEVSAQNQDGETVTPDFGRTTVVYFYPKDFTGGCTIEANEFQDALPEYEDAGVTVYGVSMDGVESHADFADEHGLEFDLLADPDGEVAAAFGIDTDEGYTDRLTFLLADGEVVATYDPELAEPKGHAREVLDDAREHAAA